MYQNTYGDNLLTSIDSFDDTQPQVLGDSSKLKVFGQGVVNVKPDMAELIIGVITEEMQLEPAQKKNSEIAQQVINSLKNMGVLEKDLQTQTYNISIKYDYTAGKPIFKGYEVNNALKVLVRNINIIGRIIDTAVENGANNVNDIRFIVSDQSEYYNEALSLALEDAQGKALVMASRLKVRLNIVPIQILEQEGRGAIPIKLMAAKSSGTAAPIEVGENKVTASIIAVFNYA